MDHKEMLWKQGIDPNDSDGVIIGKLLARIHNLEDEKFELEQALATQVYVDFKANQGFGSR